MSYPVQTSPNATLAEHAPLLVLAGDRLRVEIATPGGELYRGARFDWTGFVVQVTLDKTHTFCAPESRDGTGTGGIGLCNEFGIFRPIGFNDARPGDQFPKLGVGLLTRPDRRPYRFNRAYDIEPFKTRITCGCEQNARSPYVEFEVEPTECRGFAAHLTKRLTLHGQTLSIKYTLANVGRRTIRTQEYNHNFLALDRHPVSPDLVLSTPCELEPGASRMLETDGAHHLRVRLAPKKPFYYRARSRDLGAGREWILLHRPSGVGVRERCSLPCSFFALYGTADVISPEAFIDIKVPPGEKMEWERNYTFFADDHPN